MKETKFRFWDKENQVMYPVGTINLFVESTGDVVCYYDGKLELVKNMELLHYTGLKDKNGKEIYEGDIVAYNGGTTESRSKMEVAWCDGSYQLKAYKEDWCYDLGECLQKSLEVIGNIYENSVLR